jgi:tight adherence protein C
MQLETLPLLATVALTVALAVGSYLLARVTPLPRPVLGYRGLQRARALQEAPLFAAVEPLLRWSAALLARLPLGRLRAQLEAMIIRAGELRGLCADEHVALFVLSAAGLALVGGSAAAWLDLSRAVPCLAAVLGAALPLVSLHGHIARRQRRITRQLPLAIDLLALCMNAGLDFSGALELWVRELNDDGDPLNVECRRLLAELSMGHTRRQALASLAERVPTAAMRDFTSAVIQAEQAGNPLAPVLSIQARMMRMRRSIAAEEAAARASVLLVLPMMLLLLAIVLLMVGPFIVNGLGL